MTLRTPEQYVSSLRDGRRVFYRGTLVPDVTTHPVIGRAVVHASIDYHMAEDPKHSELAVVEKNGTHRSRYFSTPTSGEDLLKRSRLIETATRLEPPLLS